MLPKKNSFKNHIPGKGLEPFLHFDVVAIENEAFGSPSTMVAKLTN